LDPALWNLVLNETNARLLPAGAPSSPLDSFPVDLYAGWLLWQVTPKSNPEIDQPSPHRGSFETKARLPEGGVQSAFWIISWSKWPRSHDKRWQRNRSADIFSLHPEGKVSMQFGRTRVQDK